MPQAILTVIPGKEPDLANAVGLATAMKAAGRIESWRLAVPSGGITVILLATTTSPQRLEIANEFKALGYAVVEVP